MKVVDRVLRQVQVTRYIEPLKEGGSLPGLVAADDGFKYVIKFKGAGQGYKALVAELIGGLLAQTLGLKVPELVFAELDESFGRSEPDHEIRSLLKASEGQNLALHYLSGASTFDKTVNKVDTLLASQIVWFDAYIMNVDRTAKNTNMLMWKEELWLIDHGAALYFHHNWAQWEQYIASAFVAINKHVLVQYATKIQTVDEAYKTILTPEVITAIVQQIPDEWLENDGDGISATEKRKVYITLLNQRLQHTPNFIKSITDAR
jgi:hypothetical protein